MKKNILRTLYLWKHFHKPNELKHLNRIMRITTVFILTAILQMHAVNSHSQTATVLIPKSNLSVGELIDAVENQTNYLFLYNEKDIDLNRQVHVNGAKKPVNEILQQAFSDTEISYSFSEDYISLRKKSYSSFPTPQQQKRSITGTITDERGEPVIGANVVEKGTTNGVITDINGKFTFLVADNAILEITYIGYVAQNIPVKNQTNISVTLLEDSQTLDEVVIVGYGVQKKINMTGSVATVDFGEKMESRPLSTTSVALAGLSPGVLVTQSNGQPGSDQATIRIRGTGTLNSNEPLVLVDGVEWSMDNVNPNDIESISILKDASSTAIYGSRGANGVILVTTKKGKGKTHVAYNGVFSIQQPINKLALMTDYADFMELVNENETNTGLTANYSQSVIDQWREAKNNPDGTNSYGVPNRIAYPNTEWFDVLFNTGFSHQHFLSISGAGDKMNYVISGGINDNPGIMNQLGINSGERKYTFQSKVEGKAADWITIGSGVYARKADMPTAGVSSAFYYLNKSVPGIYPGEPGKWGRPASPEESTTANNPLQVLFGTGTSERYDANLSAYTIIDIIKGLQAEGRYNYQIYRTDDAGWSTTDSKIWDYVRNELYSEPNLATAGASTSMHKSSKSTVDLLLRYNNTFLEDHEVGVLAGYNQSQYNYQYTSASKQGMTDWALHELSTLTNAISVNGSSTAWRLASYFGRLNYAFKSKYLAEVNVRYDGSSRFSPDSRWGLFPSFSAGWRISEEAFMEQTKDYLSNLKLRFSWGKVGNNNSGNYDWQATYAAKSVVIDNTMISGLAVSKNGNKFLEWETTTSSDIGLDFGFLNNRLTGELDYYHKKTTGILFTPALYLTMGAVTGATENIAEVKNQGIELALRWNDHIGDFQYNIGGNFSYNQNEVTKYKGKLEKYWSDGNTYYNNFGDVAQEGFGGYIAEGYTLGETYLHKIYRGTGNYDGSNLDLNAGPKDGIIRTEKDMAWVQAMMANGYKFNGVSVAQKDQLWYGDIIYQDQNGDGNYGDTNDRNFTGHSSVPKYNFGLNVSASWKNFDIYALFTGAAGFYLYWCDDYNKPFATKGYSTLQSIADDHYFYDPANPTADKTNIHASFPRLGGKNTTARSDFWEYNGNYLKLKNVQLGYTFPKTITQPARIEHLRLFVSGENLATWTNYPGMDPEIGTSVTYPLIKQFAVGLQVNF